FSAIRVTLLTGRMDEQRTAGSIQRWSDRDHHHDHGARNEGAAWWHAARLEASAAGVFQLHPQLPLCWHLLEQPSSSASRLHQGNGRSALGQSAPVVLALTVSLHHRLDG